jgi:hypothetical protein
MKKKYAYLLDARIFENLDFYGQIVLGHMW